MAQRSGILLLDDQAPMRPVDCSHNGPYTPNTPRPVGRSRHAKAGERRTVELPGASA